MNNNIAKVIKVVLILLLMFCFFHPIATLIFLVSHFGLLVGIGLVYALLRITLGMSLLSFITKSMSEKDDIVE